MGNWVLQCPVVSCSHILPQYGVTETPDGARLCTVFNQHTDAQTTAAAYGFPHGAPSPLAPVPSHYPPAARHHPTQHQSAPASVLVTWDRLPVQPYPTYSHLSAPPCIRVDRGASGGQVYRVAPPPKKNVPKFVQVFSRSLSRYEGDILQVY